MNPDNVQSLMNLADLCTEQGNKAEAAACYRHVLDVNPRLEDARLLLEKLERGGADPRRQAVGVSRLSALGWLT